MSVDWQADPDDPTEQELFLLAMVANAVRSGHTTVRFTANDLLNAKKIGFHMTSYTNKDGEQEWKITLDPKPVPQQDLPL